MAKLELTDLYPCRTHGRQHRSALRVLLIAAAIGLVMAEGAQATDHSRDEFVIGTPASRWRVRIPATGRRHASANLAAAETWTVHRARHRRPRATLTIRCVGEGELAAYVSFHDRVSNGHSIFRYRLGRGFPQRPSSLRELLGTPEWLGGTRFVREMGKGEMLEVVIEDIGFGTSEAVFMLAGAAGVVRRLESACSAQTRPPAVPSTIPPREETGRSSTPRSAETAPSHRPSHRAGAPTPSQPQPIPSPDPSSGPAPGAPSSPRIEAERSRPGKEPLPAVIPPTQPPSESEQPQPTPPSPAEDRPDPPHKDPGEVGTTVPRAAVAEPPAATSEPPPPPPRDVEPPGDRLAAFLKRHGPNRKGEMIYGWHRRCLDHVSVDQEQVWYLSDPELTYLTRGETDQVRLSMLISTNRNVDMAPRRITCYGTARGREMMINRSE